MALLYYRMFWTELKKHLAKIILRRAQYSFLSKTLTPTAQAMQQVKGISSQHLKALLPDFI